MKKGLAASVLIASTLHADNTVDGETVNETQFPYSNVPILSSKLEDPALSLAPTKSHVETNSSRASTTVVNTSKTSSSKKLEEKIMFLPPIEPSIKSLQSEIKTKANTLLKLDYGYAALFRTGNFERMERKCSWEKRNYYGYNFYCHWGVDIGIDVGTPLYATADGTIENVEYGYGFGWKIILRHDQKWDDQIVRSVYLHNGTRPSSRKSDPAKHRIYVKKNQKVHMGEYIGDSGKLGYSSGPHLHFELLVNEKNVDPLPFWLKGQEQVLLSTKQLYQQLKK